MAILTRILIALAVIMTALAVFLATFDWNWLRSYVERGVAEHTGREFSVGGNLEVEPFSLPPRVRMEKVRFQNAPWGTAPEMLRSETLEFRINPLYLLVGKVVLPEVRLSQPSIVLERSKDGKRNWILKKTQTEADRPPYIGRLMVDRGVLIYRDPAGKTDLRIEVSTPPAADGQQAGIRFTAGGLFEGLQTSARGEGGPVLRLRDETTPYRIDARFRAGDTRLDFDGTVTGLVSLAAARGRLKLDGKDMAELFPILKISLPHTPPYRIDSELDHSADRWKLQHFSGRVGRSDLSGDAEIQASHDRRKLTGDLHSKLLDVADLSGFIGSAPPVMASSSAAQKKEAAEEAARSRVLPSATFGLQRIKAMDADVRFEAKSIQRKGLPLDNLTTHLVLQDGVLTLKPLNFGVAQGNIVAKIRLDANQTPPAFRSDVEFRKLQLAELVPQLKSTKASFGLAGGHADLSGRGQSFAEILGQANGEVALAASGGTVSSLLLAFAEINVGEIIRALLAGDSNVPMRCGVFDFSVKNGIMDSRTFIIDTQVSTITGSGQIDLKNETVNLTAKASAKQLSVLAAPSPIHVTGTFKQLHAAPEAGPLVARGGAAAVLGVLTGGIGAIIPLIEAGPGKDSPCGELIARATGKAVGR
ncbi:MAG: AsmA family protein [Sulfuricella sp.]|nr:AsmA family protein [Sulfuricella sp.]